MAPFCIIATTAAENSFGKNCNQCIFGGTLQANCHLVPNNARANFIKNLVDRDQL